MSRLRNRFRHLPPTAVPIGAADLQAGLRNTENTLEQFQAALATYLGVSHEACRLAASGRTVLYCLLRGLQADYPARQEIVMPAYTCPAVARVAIDLGLKPVFVDISRATMGYLSDPLTEAVHDDTLAVLHIHPFGIPLPADEVIDIAHKHGAVVIEDAAQALGARWAGQAVGTRGDFALYSLGPGKPISTGGGGIAIANTPTGERSLSKWWATLPPASSSGSATAWVRQAALQLAFQPHIWWAATRVGIHRVGNHETSWGYSVQGLAPSQASVGLALLPRLNEINAQRRAKASILSEGITQAQRLHTVLIAEASEPFYLRFPLLAESEEQRESLHEQLWSAGIGAGRLYERTLPSIFFPEDKASFPGAEAVAGQLLTLPTHHHVTEQDIKLMLAILQDFT